MGTREVDRPADSIHPLSVAEWHHWLQVNYLSSTSIWLVTFKKATGKPRIEYDQAVEEALCWGWIDSVSRALDEERSMVRFSRRKAGSGWSRSNKVRLGKLIAENRLSAFALAGIEAAKADGSWTKLDEVENRTVPDDLKVEFKKYSDAERFFDSFSAGEKRRILEWIVQAKTSETRSKRVAETANQAQNNVRANLWKKPTKTKEPTMKTSLMTHMIAGYPNYETSLETARALVAGGAAILEIQFPFSDPSADGPAIQAACTEALTAGFKVDDGWRLVESVRKQFPSVPVFVMSYASIVVAKGVEAFVARAKQAGVAGLIIPDLAPGADEGLYAAGKKHLVAVVPVIVPSVPKSRLESILALDPEWVYTAIRAGITGTHTTLTPELTTFLATLNQRTKVMAGFGIDSADQVRNLAGSVHTIVVGSALVREVSAAWKRGGQDTVRRDVEAKVRDLLVG